jgi:hypothetical protein
MARSLPLELNPLVVSVFVTVSLFKGLYYKKLWTRKLRKMDRFQNELVSFQLSVTFTGLDKRTSLIQNPINYKSVMFYSTGPC